MRKFKCKNVSFIYFIAIVVICTLSLVTLNLFYSCKSKEKFKTTSNDFSMNKVKLGAFYYINDTHNDSEGGDNDLIMQFIKNLNSEDTKNNISSVSNKIASTGTVTSIRPTGSINGGNQNTPYPSSQSTYASSQSTYTPYPSSKSTYTPTPTSSQSTYTPTPIYTPTPTYKQTTTPSGTTTPTPPKLGYYSDDYLVIDNPPNVSSYSGSSPENKCLAYAQNYNSNSANIDKITSFSIRKNHQIIGEAYLNDTCRFYKNTNASTSLTDSDKNTSTSAYLYTYTV